MHKSEIKPALLRTVEVAQMLGVGRTKLHQMRAAGQLPPPVFLGGTAPRWRRTDIDKWIAAQPAAPSREAAYALAQAAGR